MKLKLLAPIIVAIVIVIISYTGAVTIGNAPVIVIGGSAVVAYVTWLLTTYKQPADASKVLPLYLVAVGAQLVHETEEYLAGFPSQFSTLFHLPVFTEQFFVITFLLIFSIIWVLAGVGFIYKNPVANFLAWFFVIGPGLVNGIRHHCRTVSELTTIPRWAKSSSTSRKRSEKRKDNHTAWLMISGGKRKPLESGGMLFVFIKPFEHIVQLSCQVDNTCMMGNPIPLPSQPIRSSLAPVMLDSRGGLSPSDFVRGRMT